MCSEQWNIVNSDDWLNLIPENGVGGGPPTGRKHPLEQNAATSARQLGKSRSITARINISKGKMGIKPSSISKEKISKSLKDRKIDPIIVEKRAVANRGQFRTAETCSNISKSKLGKKMGPQSPEHIAKRIAKVVETKKAKMEKKNGNANPQQKSSSY